MEALDKLTQIVDGLAVSTPVAEPPGPRRAWTIGEVLAHSAQSIEYSLTGFPKLKSGLFRATIGPLVKRKFLRAGRMSHGVTNPIPGAPPISRTISFDDGRARLRAAIAAFRAHDGALPPHFAYGACTKDEYAVLHLLHVEDHLRA
jgi:hypothetical protein